MSEERIGRPEPAEPNAESRPLSPEELETIAGGQAEAGAKFNEEQEKK